MLNMWKPGIRLSIVAIFSLATSAAAQDKEPATPQIRTTGTATRNIRPDRAWLTLKFAVVDSTPALAGQRLALRADSVRQAIIGLGIPRDSLLTGSRWYWWPNRIEAFWLHSHCVPIPDARGGCYSVPDTIYRAREAIEVRISDLSKVGAVIDIALKLRITDISTISFSASDVREAQEAALRDATANARQQADVIAAAGGVRLGRTISLSTQSSYWDSFSTRGAVLSSASPSDGRTEITFPSVPITATVNGIWAIQER